MTARRVRVSKDKEKFDHFLRRLEHKTWREVLALIEAEYQSLNGSNQKKYCARLINLISYLRYPTKEMPKEYRPLLLTMIDRPHFLTEKLAETSQALEASAD
jgi:hypothetical protein